MTPLASRTPLLASLFAVSLCVAISAAARADDSPLVKLLKSGRVPEARQGAVIDMIGKRGTVADLDYIYERALSGGFSEPVRARVLEALVDAASTRGLKPEKDRDKLVALMVGPSSLKGSSLQGPAIRLAGAWKLEAASSLLQTIARSPMVDNSARESAIDALAAIGGKVGRSAIEELAGPGSATPLRLSAVAALARVDVAAAATRAAELIPAAAAEGSDLKPLMGAFLNQQGGGTELAEVLGRRRTPPDAAKLALRAVYSHSQADPALIAVLGKAAGISTEIKPLTPSELSSLVAEVGAKGNPERGEAVFRRKDLNCLTCHAVSKAGGDIGPDLSALGQTSPPDYIINSILLPDQSIKEQYQTVVVLTAAGQVYQGIVVDKDRQRIVLKESTGTLKIVPVGSIEEQKTGGSLMPKGLANLMTHAELVDLVRFLSELGRPGPYAIRTTPTIQRWRVLKSVSPRLAESVPDAETLRNQVLSAAPINWETVYAKVSGALPLDDAAAVVGGSKVLYLQGEIDVATGGTIQISPGFPDAIRYWLGDLAAPAGTREFTTSIVPGHHAVTVRVDTAYRSQPQLKIAIDKPAGSLAEFTVVGGK
jgi:putative heme-binding domain-containing protein